ncbi:MAG TPA: hypothetical protein VKX96_10885 [Chloroflexota bacterium]|nr:hypothetical protein [Chloroflexota bacterium]
MVTLHRLSPQQAKYERAKAERANYIVSEVISDPQFMSQGIRGIESCEHGICMLWPEFLQWESAQFGQDAPHAKDQGPKLKFTPRVAPRVRDFIASLTHDDRILFEHHLAALCTNPHIDNVTKFSVPYPPIILFLYQDGPFRILYRIVGGTVVELLNVGEASYVPSIDEWDEWR